MDTFQPRNHRLYFGYGILLASARVAALCNRPEPVATARLKDHRLAFFGHLAAWDGGGETLVHQPGGEVWGVVYRLSLSDAEALDAWRDVRMDGTGAYFQYPGTVVDAQGVAYSVLYYKKNDCRDPQPPSEEYLAAILAGAAERGFPEAYRAELARTATRKARYPVPRGGFAGGEGWLRLDCTGCSGDSAADDSGQDKKEGH